MQIIFFAFYPNSIEELQVLASVLCRWVRLVPSLLYLSNCLFYSITFSHPPIAFKFAYQPEDEAEISLLSSLLSKLSNQEPTFSLRKVRQTQHSTLLTCSLQVVLISYPYFFQTGTTRLSNTFSLTGLCF